MNPFFTLPAYNVIGSVPAALIALEITKSTDGPVAVAWFALPVGVLPVSACESPCACPQPLGPGNGKLMPFTMRRFFA